MLQVLRRSQRWILWLVIFVLGGAFVFFLGSGRGSRFRGAGAQVAVRVGDRQFDFRDLDRVRERQIQEYRRALGDAFDPSAAADYLDQLAAQSLVQLAILAEEAKRLGLRVGEGEIREYLRGVPGGTAADGRIDRDVWTQHAEREYGSVVRFEAALREDLLARKTSRLLEESISLSDAEIRDVLRYQMEQVQVAYVAVDPQALRAKQEVADAEVEALLDRRPPAGPGGLRRAQERVRPARAGARPSRPDPGPLGRGAGRGPGGCRGPRQGRAGGGADPRRRALRAGGRPALGGYGLEERGRRPRLLFAGQDGGGLRGGRVLAPPR